MTTKKKTAKKTAARKPVAVKAKPEPTYSITGCELYAVKFDAPAVNAVQLIAEGLVANAQALGSLARRVLLASNVHIESLVRVGPTVSSGEVK